MPKITLLGAGSGFTQGLFTDILNIEGLDEGVIGLVDIDAGRLAINTRLMERVVTLMGKKNWRIESSTDRRKILRGTDYLISTIEVSGVQCVQADNNIPLSYGIDQAVGDTIGPGGIMKALRTLPSFIEILEDAKRFCPGAMIMNYTNPMSIITLGAVRVTDQPFAGLCHSVQSNSRVLAAILGVSYEEFEWKCGGINHMAWFTVLKHRGRDLHARLRACFELPGVMAAYPVRAALVRSLGYFATESCRHFSEYVPYFRKSRDLLKKYGLEGSTGAYSKSWPAGRLEVNRRRREMAAGKRKIPLQRGYEYASDIIEAHCLGRPKIIYASVPNTGLIPNLPAGGVVETATLVDRRGYQPTYFGPLPEQCAALCRSNMAVFELCVQGILNRDREAIVHAMMLDPLSAAACSLDEIRAMAGKLFEAEQAFIPAWCREPKRVIARGPLPPLEPKTPFAMSLLASKIMPPADIKNLAYPADKKALALKPRAFKGVSFCQRHKELKKAGAALVYFAAHLHCRAAMRLAMLLGHDGAVKAWIDSREAYCNPVAAYPARTDKGRVPFDASKGIHEILIAFDSDWGSAEGIFLRFERLDAPRAKALRWDMLPEVRP
ncbi:MAG: alpha-glucosidase/alpha-galactosidase [Kiritimatiellia bacterium]